MQGARRGELAVVVIVDRELHHIDAVLAGPPRDRGQRAFDGACRVNDQRNAPRHRVGDHPGTLARDVVTQLAAHRLHPRACAPRLEGDDERQGRDDAAEDLERRAQAEWRHEDAGGDRRERQRRVATT